MKIDFNPTECAAMEAFKKCDYALGAELQGNFVAELKEFKKAGGDHCSCPADCTYHGNCMLCVQIHRGHGDHLPYCMQLMLNKKIAVLSELTEHSIVREVKRPSYLGGDKD